MRVGGEYLGAIGIGRDLQASWGVRPMTSCAPPTSVSVQDTEVDMNPTQNEWLAY